jgi:hypothetical protein
MPSPTPDPGSVAAEPTTKLDGCLEQRQLCASRPGLRLVAVTAAPMARGAAQRHVHRERAAMARRGGVQRTASLPLHPRALRGLEAEQDRHLLPRDLPANCLEADTRHGCSALADGVVACLSVTVWEGTTFSGQWEPPQRLRRDPFERGLQRRPGMEPACPPGSRPLHSSGAT